MKNKFILFADVMQWSTIFLMAIFGYLEHQLLISTLGHTLLQILSVLLGCGWALLWTNIGERQRLMLRYKPGRKGRQETCQNTMLNNDPDAQIAWRHYGSNN